MADLSKIVLPSGSEYNIKDAKAREDIAALQSIKTYLGITTTELMDGATTTSIVISGETVTVSASDAGVYVIYGELEFVWNGSKWQELGSTSNLGDLAFKDTATGSVTPAGSVSLTDTAKTPTVSLKTPGSTDTIHNPTKVTVAKTVEAAAPGAAAPNNAITYYSVSGETLNLYQLGYTTGDSITTEDVTVKTDDGVYEAGSIDVPTSASFSGSSVAVSVS